jgi:hypothetical protein
MLSSRAAGALTLLVLTLPVASSCSSQAPSPSPSAQATIAGSDPGLPRVLRCGTNEFYIPAAMNRLLGTYPELAASAGLQSVSSCSEARALMKSHKAYGAAHPGFDRDQPVPRVYGGHPPAPPADAPRPTFSGPKIGGLGTTPIQVAPVVRIIFPRCPYVTIGTPPMTSVDQCLRGLGADAGNLATILARLAEGGIVETPEDFLGSLISSCTATFIGKRWLITAAHCLLQNMPPFTDGNGQAINNDGTSDAGGSRDWIYNVTIDWAHAPGQGAGSGTAIQLVPGVGFADGGVLTAGDGQNVAGELTTIGLAYIHPNFLGYDSGTSLEPRADTAHDVALFYLPSSDDFFLPSDPNTGSAMPISVVQPSQMDTPSFFGWGHPTSGVLNEGNFPGMQFMVNGDGLTLNLNYPPTSTNTSTWPGPFLCGGDSGGPGVRQLAVSIIGGAAQPTAIVGTESGGAKVFAPDGGQTDCAGPGTSDTLVRTDTLLTSFIEPSMRDYNGDNFSCVRLPEDTSNGVQTYAECWKKACLVDSDCALANPNAVFGDDAGPSTRVQNGDGGVTVYFCAGANSLGTFKGECLSYQEQNGSFGADDGGTE